LDRGADGAVEIVGRYKAPPAAGDTWDRQRHALAERGRYDEGVPGQ
jgi:hypothetical protein